MTSEDAESLGISATAFKCWHHLQFSTKDHASKPLIDLHTAMIPRFLSIEHVSPEGIGTISAYIQDLGGQLARHRQYRRQPLSVPHDDYDVLVVMGGPMGVHDSDQYPWLDLELRFIREAIDRGKHVLGICLGAQLIAKALGAEVRKNPCTEIGWFPVLFEDTFLDSRPGQGLDRQMDVLHWHGDTFAMPPGAIRVAGSEACTNQGFLFEGRVLGLQFHLEMGVEEADVMIKHFGHELVPEKFIQDAKEIRERTAECAAPAQQALFSILNGFLEH